MLYSRQQVQQNLRNRDGKRVFYLGRGDQLTSDARDWLTRERIPILPAEQATPERYALLGGGAGDGAGIAGTDRYFAGHEPYVQWHLYPHAAGESENLNWCLSDRCTFKTLLSS